MVNTLPGISLIIAVYERSEDLEKVILSLKNQRYRDFEILIADDGSGLEVAKVIERHSADFRFPIVHEWHENKGFRKTVIVNKAAGRARSDYLVFIDGDCICHSRFVERHWIRKAPGIVLFGRRVRLGEELTTRVTAEDISTCRIERSRYWWKGAIAGTRHHGIYLPRLYGIRNRLKKNYPILGSNFSLHKSDYLLVNGYDERIIGRGMEDSNLWARLKLAGIQSRRISHEAIQYHLYHRFDPIPHDRETVQKFCNPTKARTHFGMVQSEECHTIAETIS